MSGSLNHSPAHIIRNLLVTLGLGTDPDDNNDWPMFVSREPNTPDSVITLYDTSSRLQGRFQKTGETQEHYGIQLRVRSASYVDGYAKANALTVALDESIKRYDVSMEDVSGTGTSTYRVYAVTRTTGVIDIGKDVATSKRNLFTINAVVSLQQTN